jgi:DNA-binding NarL/FixJ family response regulator
VTSAAARPVRLFIVEDDLAVRKGVELVLRGHSITMVGAAAEAGPAYGEILATRPDVALIDVNLAGESGARLADRLLRRRPELGVLMYTGLADPEEVRHALACGARGVALKGGSPDELLDGIRTVAGGGRYIDRRIKPVMPLGAGAEPPAPPAASASALEPEVPARAASEPHGRADRAPDLLDGILRFARQELAMDVSFMSELTDDEQRFHRLDGDGASFGIVVGSTVPLEASWCAQMVAGRLPGLVRDARRHERGAGTEVDRRRDIGAYVGAALQLGDGRLYGTLGFYSHGVKPELGERESRLVRVLADHTAKELDQRRLERGPRDPESEAGRLRLAPTQDAVGRLVAELGRPGPDGRLLSLPVHAAVSILLGRTPPGRPPVR